MNNTVKCNGHLEVRLNDAFHDQLIGVLEIWVEHGEK